MVFPLGDVEKTRIFPIATYGLIALNVIAYVLQLQQGETFTSAYAATPYEITHLVDLDSPVEVVGQFGGVDAPERAILIPQAPIPIPVWLTLLTSMFLHGSPMHIAGNMLYLWIFGDNVEEVLGTVRYVLVYLTCGLVGSLLQIAASPNSVIPTLGASGAIAGVMGMYIVWFPHHRIRVLIFRVITELPAVFVIGLWIAIQLFSGFGAWSELGQTGGVAYLAHVGGAAAGIGFAMYYYRQARAVILRSGYHHWDETISLN